VKVVRKLLDFSADEQGKKAFESDTSKQDDMADALLLGCGTAFGVQKEKEKQARKLARASKPKGKSKI
jgi:hypothetical protein